MRRLHQARPGQQKNEAHSGNAGAPAYPKESTVSNDERSFANGGGAMTGNTGAIVSLHLRRLWEYEQVHAAQHSFWTVQA